MSSDRIAVNRAAEGNVTEVGGRPAQEEVLVERLGPNWFRLLRSPGTGFWIGSR
jgi:hypothetical protein